MYLRQVGAGSEARLFFELPLELLLLRQCDVLLLSRVLQLDLQLLQLLLGRREHLHVLHELGQVAL